MLELGAGADILRGVSWLYIGLIGVLVIAALWLPKRWWQKLIGVVAVLLVFTGPAYLRNRDRGQIVDKRKARYEAAKALFDERCKTAGEKIYETVEEVEEVLLTSVRGRFAISNYADQQWMYAGFPGESSGGQYVMEFLYYNIPQHGQYLRALGPTPGGTRGYRYVDIQKDQTRIRYMLRSADDYSVGGSDPVKSYAIEKPATDEPPRYVVAYEAINDPEGRAQWIAGGRVTVIDRKNGKLLGEFVRYALEPGFGNTDGERSPWAFAVQCPQSEYGGRTGHIRSFVERVVKPKQGK